ncbi:unnamed protein product [Brassicogethes aeneus]|uniref:Acyltransferase 3 domain-containing protein n=1 Tax=Brassicogethes aeneus TaxID=1431903 RepID=A0A9P0AWX3_BRAAE|nr:unnamed protein product [Brassicogethes aeneus]
MILTFVICAFIFVNRFCWAFQKITDNQYALMPNLFHLDDYDKCMLLQNRALYCSITFELEPLDAENPSEIWKIVKSVSSVPSNYRHDHLRHGICVPTTCPNTSALSLQDQSEITKDINDCYNNKYENMGLKGNVTKIDCLTYNFSYPIDQYDIIVAVLILFYIGFIIFASVYEEIAKRKSRLQYDEIISKTIGKYLAAFSISKNWKRLTKVDENQELRCLAGIKFFNMIFVVLAHTMLSVFAGGIFNTKFSENLTKNTFNMIIINGTYIIQSFFLISGWLLSYNFFLMFEKRKFRLMYLPMVFVNRYIRLTPVFVVVLAFHCTWLVHLPRGPQWHKAVEWEHHYCRKNWWTNMLYVNNYVDKEHMCMEHTWYLAADTQLFAVSLIILGVVFKIPKYTKLILGFFFAMGVFLPGLVSWVTNSDILTRLYPENLYLLLLETENFHTLYTSAYSNVGGYALGLLSGYVYYKTKDIKINITTFHVLFWWLLTFGSGLFVILIAGIMYNDDFTYTRLEAALYWAFGKNVFVFAVALAIFGATRNLGGIIKKILELRMVQILSRLTYSVYIVHVTLLKYKKAVVRSPSYLSYYTVVYDCFSDLCLSYITGLLLCLLFEMPISALQKIFIPQLSSKSQPNLNDIHSKTNEEEELKTSV